MLKNSAKSIILLFIIQLVLSCQPNIEKNKYNKIEIIKKEINNNLNGKCKIKGHFVLERSNNDTVLIADLLIFSNDTQRIIGKRIYSDIDEILPSGDYKMTVRYHGFDYNIIIQISPNEELYFNLYYFVKYIECKRNQNNYLANLIAPRTNQSKVQLISFFSPNQKPSKKISGTS